MLRIDSQFSDTLDKGFNQMKIDIQIFVHTDSFHIDNF